MLKTMLLLTIVVCGTGCTTGYWVDRGRDASDIFTCTIGIGAGVKGRVGPVQLGILSNVDMWGVRGGKFGEVTWYETCTKDTLFVWPMDGAFGTEHFVKNAGRDLANRRGKQFVATAPIPILGISESPEYYTQVEVVIGVMGSLRLGFNAGELLDFLLGFAGVDIYHDDLEQRIQKIKQTDDSPNGPNP